MKAGSGIGVRTAAIAAACCSGPGESASSPDPSPILPLERDTCLLSKRLIVCGTRLVRMCTTQQLQESDVPLASLPPVVDQFGFFCGEHSLHDAAQSRIQSAHCTWTSSRPVPTFAGCQPSTDRPSYYPQPVDEPSCGKSTKLQLHPHRNPNQKVHLLCVQEKSDVSLSGTRFAGR